MNIPTKTVDPRAKQIRSLSRRIAEAIFVRERHDNRLFWRYRAVRESYQERNDCTVRALTAIFDVSYAQAHWVTSRRGRRHRHGWTLAEWLGSFGAEIDKAGPCPIGVDFKLPELRSVARHNSERPISSGLLRTKGGVLYQVPAKYPKAITLVAALQRFSRGTFYMHTASHAFAVIDGKVQDYGGMRSRCRITRVIEILKPRALLPENCPRES